MWEVQFLQLKPNEDSDHLVSSVVFTVPLHVTFKKGVVTGHDNEEEIGFYDDWERAKMEKDVVYFRARVSMDFSRVSDEFIDNEDDDNGKTKPGTFFDGSLVPGGHYHTGKFKVKLLRYQGSSRSSLRNIKFKFTKSLTFGDLVDFVLNELMEEFAFLPYRGGFEGMSGFHAAVLGPARSFRSSRKISCGLDLVNLPPLSTRRFRFTILPDPHLLCIRFARGLCGDAKQKLTQAVWSKQSISDCSFFDWIMLDTLLTYRRGRFHRQGSCSGT